jgi:hypothetical protein
LSDGLTLLLYLFFAGISTESCSIFNEFVIQKTPARSKNRTGVWTMLHRVVAGELLVGVRAGMTIVNAADDL